MRATLRILLNAYDFLVIYLGMAWLGILCLAWTPIAMAAYVLLPESRGQALGRYGIMMMFRIFLATLSLSRRCSFDLEALDALRDEPSLIANRKMGVGGLHALSQSPGSVEHQQSVRGVSGTEQRPADSQSHIAVERFDALLRERPKDEVRVSPQWLDRALQRVLSRMDDDDRRRIVAVHKRQTRE